MSVKKKIISFTNHLTNLLEKKGFFLPIEKKKSMLLNIQKIKFDTICIHSDTNNSIDILKKIDKEFNGR